MDLDVCSDCTAEPPCSTCGLPRAGRNAGDDGHCTRCIDAAERCGSCARPIFDRYWKVAGSDAIYCGACRREAPPCTVCGAPTRSGRMQDGRMFCEPCHSARVGEGAYDGLLDDVLRRAENRLGMTLNKVPKLVVERESRLQNHEALDGPHAGLSGLYVRDGFGRSSIHILSDLPAIRATAVLAHEFAHAWQAEQCPPDQSLRIREGFAEWVAWRLLADVDGAESERQIIAARTDVYGDGFRLFERMERESGTSHCLWWARSVVSDESD